MPFLCYNKAMNKTVKAKINISIVINTRRNRRTFKEEIQKDTFEKALRAVCKRNDITLLGVEYGLKINSDILVCPKSLVRINLCLNNTVNLNQLLYEIRVDTDKLLKAACEDIPQKNRVWARKTYVSDLHSFSSVNAYKHLIDDEEHEEPCLGKDVRDKDKADKGR